MNTFLTSNSAAMRLARTIFQGIIGVIVAFLDVIIGFVPCIPDELRPVIVARCMAILSPIMKSLGGKDPEVDDNGNSKDVLS